MKKLTLCLLHKFCYAIITMIIELLGYISLKLQIFCEIIVPIFASSLWKNNALHHSNSRYDKYWFNISHSCIRIYNLGKKYMYYIRILIGIKI